MENLKVEHFLEQMGDKAKECLPPDVAFVIVVWEYDVPGVRYQSTATTPAMLQALAAVLGGHSTGGAEQLPLPRKGLTQ